MAAQGAFELLAEKIETRQDVSLAAIAIEAGYGDQAHLSRDCRVSTGRTPSVLLRHVQCEEAGWLYRTYKSPKIDH